MLGAIGRKFFGGAATKRMRGIRAVVDAVNAREAIVSALGDDDLAAETVRLRALLAAGSDLDDLMPEAFAAVREAALRAIGQRHFDVQIMGGAVLSRGGIAEMRTGEGKTLVATLAAYHQALAGHGVHVVTANDYLAARDAETMGRVFKLLGLSVGVIRAGLDDQSRRFAYAADVTYATHAEIGFDFLRDNMRYDPAHMVQRGHAFALVDEVDLILIDEARTPLIISGQVGAASELCAVADIAAAALSDGDYDVDEKARTAHLTEAGGLKAEDLLADTLAGRPLFDGEGASVLHHLMRALTARVLYKRDRDYAVIDGKVVIIDEATGRLQNGRRYGDGLHSAVEAKENVVVEPETATLASITYQNLFRLYKRLSGMTGTAATEADEFAEIYRLEVVPIPTNRPVLRLDDEDEVYRTSAERAEAVVQEVFAAASRLQPVLIGTASVARSEEIAAALTAAGYRRLDFCDPDELGASRRAALDGRAGRCFAVLNASNHGLEAAIVAEAGVPGAVTVSTNMAGRGTDIKLGGSVETRVAIECAGLEGEARAEREAVIAREVATLRDRAVEAGGLYVIGTERHESRRIDNQLRGRSGRQGDPGRSKFVLSLDDDLMRIFGSAKLEPILTRLGIGPGQSITHPLITRSLQRAQTKVERHHFDMRKTVLKYDDVVNDQRKAVFAHRRETLDASSVAAMIDDMRASLLEDVIAGHALDGAHPSDWDIPGLEAALQSAYGVTVPVAPLCAEGRGEDEVAEAILATLDAAAASRREADPVGTARRERFAVLDALDAAWRLHMEAIDALRNTVGWHGLAQRDPLNEFRAEAFAMFERMTVRLRADVIQRLTAAEAKADAAAVTLAVAA